MSGTIRMRALAHCRHAGVIYKPGEYFEVATTDEASELVAVGFAHRADVAAVEQADPPEAEPPHEGPKSGRYDRRDVRAKP